MALYDFTVLLDLIDFHANAAKKAVFGQFAKHPVNGWLTRF